MSEVINGYELLEPFQNKNAGFSRWTFGIRDNREYFLKEFLNPVYPTDDTLALNLRKERIEDCKDFEKRQKNLYQTINNVTKGNAVRILEFFRADNHYYIATERIHDEGLSLNDLQKIPFEDRVLLCKTIAYEIKNLHGAQVVHADLKRNNILIKRTEAGKLVGKIIDFDASFYEDAPPQYEEELGGDQVYLSPEACQFICGDSVKLTCKIDVFALGLLFHQYLTGALPEFDTDEYDYTFDAVLDGQQLRFSPELPNEFQMMFKGMLECDPKKRLSMEDVYSIFDDLDSDKKGAADIDPEEYIYSDVDRDEERKTEQEIRKPEDWFVCPGDL